MIYIRKRQKNFRIVIIFTSFFTIICIVLGFLFLKIRPVILDYAVSNAETILLNTSNDAIVEILKEENTDYNDIVRLSYDSSGYVTSLETDITNINLLKSRISNKISHIVSERQFYSTAIPLGTFFGNELLSGVGPLIKFKFQLTSTSVVDFEHEFTDAGINQVLHKIIINIETKGFLITTGSADSISVKTTAIAAQTVIVGVTPNSFTEVIEEPTSDTAGIINDYGAY